MGVVAAVVAWSMPSYYVSEARVQVGVQAPRVFTSAEAVITDINPDAERVQNEGFILQSRTLAKIVIDKLRLADNPEFNPELRKPSFWSRVFRVDQFIPSSAIDWFNRLTSRPAKVQPNPVQEATLRDNRMIDILLSQVDVSLLGRSHVLSVKAESRNGTTAASIANTLADTYLDYQRKEKVATLDRVDKFLLGRIAELREQVQQVRPGGRGLSAQPWPLQELEQRRHHPAAHRAQHPAHSGADRQGRGRVEARRGAGDAQRRPRSRKRARGPDARR